MMNNYINNYNMMNNYINNYFNKHSKLDTFKSSYLDEILEESSLDCKCGSKLTSVISYINPYRYAFFILGPEPKVKTRAKRKIVLKKYRRKFRNIMLSVRLLAPLRNKPMYICNNCGNKM